MLLGLGLVPLPALAAIVSIEVYRFNQNWSNISDSTAKINFYVNGDKVLSEKSCPYTEPCKVEITKKAVLSICGIDSLASCQTGILFDPTQAPNQRVSVIENFSGYAILSYIIFSPNEFPVLNEYLQKQLVLEKQRDEIKNRAPN
jgi:hypothetical protein